MSLVIDASVITMSSPTWHTKHSAACHQTNVTGVDCKCTHVTVRFVCSGRGRVVKVKSTTDDPEIQSTFQHYLLVTHSGAGNGRTQKYA